MCVDYQDVFGYGMFVSNDEIRQFESNDITHFADFFLNHDEFADWALGEITMNGCFNWKDDGIVILADKQGTIFDKNNDSAVAWERPSVSTYHTPDDMVCEFQLKYGDCLPDDFNITSHLCMFSGVQKITDDDEWNDDDDEE